MENQSGLVYVTQCLDDHSAEVIRGSLSVKQHSKRIDAQRGKGRLGQIGRIALTYIHDQM